MRDLIHNSRRTRAGIAFLVILLASAGCGGGDDGGGEPPLPDCSISEVRTGLTTSWFTDDIVEIFWEQNGVPDKVKIELTRAGTVVATLAESADNDGYQSWTVPADQVSGDDFGIRVTGVGESDCSAEVTGLRFINTTGCAITYTSFVDDGRPDSLVAGEDFMITWDSNNTSTLVDLVLHKSLQNSAGDSVGVIAMDVPDTGSYAWTVDSFHVGDLYYRIRVVDRQVGGCEAVSPATWIADPDLCNIEVFGPSDGGTYVQGDNMSVTIDQSLGSGWVNVRLYAGNEFVPNGYLYNGLPADPSGSFNWTIDNYGYTGAQTNFKIKAFDVNDGYCVGESGRFTILPN